MARIARADVLRSDEIAIVHVMNRTVRRCFLMGDDPLTGCSTALERFPTNRVSCWTLEAVFECGRGCGGPQILCANAT